MFAPHEIVEESDFSEFDCVFISYDEPNAEYNYAINLQRVPWLKRVHGVKGFDAAHKAAAELCRTSRFLTIDGDCLIDANFMNQRLRLRAGLHNHVLNWKSYNPLHGLCYGNGSLKCWPREVVLSMNTHEVSSEKRSAVDFCWTVASKGMLTCWSETHSASSPFQAFRSGFREGCKITLSHGEPIPPQQIIYHMWQEAMTLLRVWCTVGADTPNGYWSILGARAGLSLMMDYPSTEYQKIADYDWFVAKFHEYVGKVGGKVDDLHEYIVYDDALMIQTIESLGHYIKERSNLEFCMFDPAQSRMVKTLLKPPVYNLDPMVEG